MQNRSIITLIILAFFSFNSCNIGEEYPIIKVESNVLPSNSCPAPCNATLQAIVDSDILAKYPDHEFKWFLDEKEYSSAKDTTIDNYYDIGSHKIKLVFKVDTKKGKFSVGDSAILTVNCGSNIIPKIKTEPDPIPNPCYAPCQVKFISDSDVVGVIKNHHWDFDDGNTISTDITSSVTHRFKRAKRAADDTFNVKLTVETVDGCEKTTSFPISVSIAKFNKNSETDVDYDFPGGATDILQLEDGSYWVLLEKGNVLRVNKDGTLNKVGSFMSPPNSYHNKMVKDFSNRFLVISQNIVSPNGDMLSGKIIKYDSINNTFPPMQVIDELFPAGNKFNITDLKISSNGEYLITGVVDPPANQGNKSLYVMRICPSGEGEILFVHIFSKENLEDVIGGEIQEKANGNIFISGREIEKLGNGSYYPIIYESTHDLMEVEAYPYSPSFSFFTLSPTGSNKFVTLNGTHVRNQFKFLEIEPPGKCIPTGTNNFSSFFRNGTATDVVERFDDPGNYAGVGWIYNEESGTSDGVFLLSKNRLVSNNLGASKLNALIQTSDGGFAMVGEKDNKPVIIKVDPNGDL